MDIHLHYIEKGQGNPLILLHGNGEDASYFVHQIEYFAKKYRVLAVDTRGHGESPRGNAPTREIYGHLLNAELVMIPGDHFIANKKPVEFNQAVETFLMKSTI